MPSLLKKALLFLVSASLTMSSLPLVPAVAQVSTCVVTVAPTQVSGGSTSSFAIIVNNTSSSIIVWVKITRPSENFTLTQAVASGWTINQTSATTTFSGGTMLPGQNKIFQERNVAIANVSAPSENWTVEVSDDAGGANPTICTGNLGTAINGSSPPPPPPDTTAPTISNVNVSAVTLNSATIAWTTNENANSKIDFGLSTSYGQTVSDSSLGTSHSLKLQNLSAATTYHYKVSSTDASNNTGSNSDSTFKTSSTGSGSSGPSNSISFNKLNVESTEKVPPTISFTSKTAGVYKTGPIITGKAEDNVGVLLLEYSVDNGKNWLPAKKTSGLGSKKATFEFSTDNLAEGDFQVLARAIDTSGNETRTPSFTLVVDILQPFVGGSLISFGPQILSQEDSLKTMVGLKQKITVPAIGGATSVAIVARKDQVETLFKLSPLEESNLWSGEASFAESGSYDLQVVSKDGAKNEVKRSLGVVSVTAPGQIVDEANKTPIPEAKVGLYFLEPESASWVVWDGSGFGVENPQKTNDKGQFSFFVPKGKYYLKIEAKDYLPLTSEIFETETAAPISTGISLSKPMLKIGPLILDWRLFFAEKIEIKSLDSKNLASKDIETILPNFSLDSTSGEKVSSLSFRGKPTLITVLGTWSPPSNEQLPILEQLSQNKDLNIVPLVSLESLGKVQVQKEISGSSLDLLVDPHGEVTQKLQFQTLPTHYLISRNGVIKKVLVGVLSKEDLLSELGSQ